MNYCNLKYILSSIFLVLIFTTGCDKDDRLQLPTLTTLPATDINSNSTTSGGYITDDGGASVTSRGIVWSSSDNPTIDNNDGMTTDSEGAGRYYSNLTGLDEETTYYVRAYAINSLGEAYGNKVSFTTLELTATGRAVTDIDGNQYSTIIVNEKEWMAENLRVTRYNNGDDIHTNLDISYWGLTTAGAYAVYPHELADGIGTAGEMKKAYGSLYNWFAVDQGLLCPTGWRVPAVQDWEDLINYLIETHEEINSGNVGNYLKSCLQEDSPIGGDCDTSEHPRWRYNENHWGADELGFGALPGGLRNFGGYFDYAGDYAFWWSANEAGEFFAWVKAIGYNSGSVTQSSYRKQLGFSVRCIRDAE